MAATFVAVVPPSQQMSNASTSLCALGAQMAKNEVKRKREVLAATYGAHVPLRMQMESEILSQYRRLPTLQSSMVGLDTLAGRDTQINISDVFGALSLKSASPHTNMAAHGVCLGSRDGGSLVVCRWMTMLVAVPGVQISQTHRTHRKSICTNTWRSSSD